MRILRHIIYGIIIINFLFCSISILTIANTATFTLKSWEVIDDDGYPGLLIKFDVTENVELTMLNPDGVQVDWDYVDETEHGVNIDLAGYHETPKSGTYIFVVKTSWPEVTIFTKDFTFNRPDLSIIDIQPTWKYYENLRYYSMTNIDVTINNSGDLPIYPVQGRVELNGESDSLWFSSSVVMPNEQKTISASVYMSDIDSGTYTLILFLEDGDDANIGTYSKTVSLEEQKSNINFTLDSWEVIDDGGWAALLMQFSVTESVELTLIDPKGVQVDWDYVDETETGVEMSLAGLWDTPIAGTYTFVVKSSWPEEIIFTKDFTFNGPDVTIKDVSFEWEYKSGRYSTTDISVFCQNSGDLPCYPNKLTVQVGSDVMTTILSGVWLPGEGVYGSRGYFFNGVRGSL